MDGRNEPSLSKFVRKLEREMKERRERHQRGKASRSSAAQTQSDDRKKVAAVRAKLRDNIQRLEEKFNEDPVNRFPESTTSQKPSDEQRKALNNLRTKRFDVESLEGTGIRDDDTEKFVNLRGDWQFKQRIGELEAEVALEAIDPQTVIEALLSREWAKIDENARWRRGLKDLRAKLTALGGEIPFAHLKQKGSRANKAQKKPSMEEAKKRYTKVERQLYESIIRAHSNRTGWSSIAWERYRGLVNPILDKMEEFTPWRLELEFNRDILSAWTITLLVPPTPTAASVDHTSVREAAKRLVKAMQEIADLEISGEPSDLDPHVSAVKARLTAILYDTLKLRHKEVDREITDKKLDLEIKSGRGWRIDAVRKAAEFAGQYCDAQRDALFNMLAKTYQKPDFCIRRDCVGSAATREYYFPISDSWDEDWYGGK
jgi:hypothetical protein